MIFGSTPIIEAGRSFLCVGPAVRVFVPSGARPIELSGYVSNTSVKHDWDLFEIDQSCVCECSFDRLGSLSVAVDIGREVSQRQFNAEANSELYLRPTCLASTSIDR